MCQRNPSNPPGESYATGSWFGHVQDAARRDADAANLPRRRGLNGDAIGGERFAALPGVLGRLGLHRGMTPFHLADHPDSCRWKRTVTATRRAVAAVAVAAGLAACGDDGPPHVREGVIVAADTDAGTVTLRDENGNETTHDGTHEDLDGVPSSDWAAFVAQAAAADEVNRFAADDVFNDAEPTVPWSGEITPEELGVEINYDVADDEDEGEG